MAYNTGNPIGSTDARDLYDNAMNFDKAVNQSDPRWTDRFGVSRPSWSGIAAFVDLGEYTAGLEISGYNEIFRLDGEYYKPLASTVLPYTTTGSWSDDSVYFANIGDALLRQDLAENADTTIGYYRNAINCNKYGGLQAALADSDSVGKILIVTDEQTITSSVSTGNRKLFVEFGGLININNGQTLTINGPFQCGLYQCFNCIGTGKVVWGSGSITEVYPDWWGITGTADDVAINKALTSLGYIGGTVKLLPKTYNITNTITITGANIKLSGFGASISSSAAMTSFISVDNVKNTLEGFTIVKPIGAGAVSQAILVTGYNHNITDIRSADSRFATFLHCVNMWESHITRLRVDASSANPADPSYKYGVIIQADYSVNNTVTDCFLAYGDVGIWLTDVANPIDGNRSEGWMINATSLIYLNRAILGDSITSLSVLNSMLDLNYISGIEVTNGQAMTIVGNWIAGVETGFIGIIGSSTYNKSIISANTFVGNAVGGMTAVSLTGPDTIFSGNTIQNMAGGVITHPSSSVYGNIYDATSTRLSTSAGTVKIEGDLNITSPSYLTNTVTTITDRFTSGYATGQTITSNVPLTSGVYQLYVQSENSANDAATGIYLIGVIGTQITITEIVSAGGVAVSSSGAAITVTNSSGSGKVLYATIQKLARI